MIESNQTVSYFAHEQMMSRMERTIRRLWILCIILIVCLIGTNAGWIYYESQWEEVTSTYLQEVTQETDNGSNQFVGGDYYGETNSQDK